GCKGSFLQGRDRCGTGCCSSWCCRCSGCRRYSERNAARLTLMPSAAKPAAFFATFAAALCAAAVAIAQGLPPPSGPEMPRVEPLKGDDGLYHQRWFVQSFLDLREDYVEAEARGKRFAVVFEQRGCIYCTKMH